VHAHKQTVVIRRLD